MRALGWVVFSVVTIVPLSACEAVVGDLGSYSGACSPIKDQCPKATPCVYDSSTSSFACESHSGTKQEDNPCTSEADCLPGYSCSQFMNNTTGHCSQYCADNSSCSTNNCYGFTVKRYLPSGDQIGACGPLPSDGACDPLATMSGSCGTGKRCQIFDTDYTKCITLSSPALAVGATCVYINDCTPGSSCIGSTSSGYTCRKLCDFASPMCPTTPTMTTCQEYTTPRMLGTKHIGICLPP